MAEIFKSVSTLPLPQVIADLKEATELYLEEFPLTENKLPITTTFEASYAQTA